MGLIFFSLRNSHTKGLLLLLHPGFESVTEVDNDPKRRFMFLKAAPSNDKVIYVYTPSAHNTIEKLARGHLFEGLQFYMNVNVREMKTK